MQQIARINLRRLIVLVLVFVLLAFFFIWGALVSPRAIHASYQGRDLDSWLEGIASSDPSVRAGATDAFRAWGTNIAPTLAAMMGTKDDSKVSFMLKGFVSVLTRKSRPLEAERHWRDAKALRAIGPPASIAIPSLTALLDSPESGDKAVYALAGLGPKAVASLTRALTNSNANVRLTAAGAMGSFGSDANGAVPALVLTLVDPKPQIRQQAVQSLGQIAGQPEVVIPALIAALSDSDPGVRMSTALALSSFHEKAKMAVPSLLKAQQDPDAQVRQAAMNALSSIGRGGADLLTH